MSFDRSLAQKQYDALPLIITELRGEVNIQWEVERWKAYEKNPKTGKGRDRV